MNKIKELYFRMSFVHYVGIILLVLNGLLLTENIFSQIIQIVVALVIIFHEWDENKNGRNLSKQIISRFEDITNDKIIVNTGFAAEYDVLNKTIEKMANHKREEKERDLILNRISEVFNKLSKGDYSQKIKEQTDQQDIKKLINNINNMMTTTEEHMESLNKTLGEYAKFDYSKELKLNNINTGSLFDNLQVSVNNFRGQTERSLKGNKEGAKRLEDNNNKLKENMNEVNNSSTTTENTLSNVEDSLNNINNKINNNNETIKSMTNSANIVTKAVTEGNKLAEQTNTSMEEISSEVNEITKAIEQIDQIAFQTNILSLNAAVEAATAGEHGKGFAVVAQEVRNLAARSTEAAEDIKKLVNSATGKTVIGKQISNQMIEGYTSLDSNIKDTIKSIEEVEHNSKEQSEEITTLNSFIEELNQATNENNTIIEKTIETTEETEKIVIDIMNMTKNI